MKKLFSAGCPSPQKIIEVLDGRGKESKNRWTLEHLTVCPRCWIIAHAAREAYGLSTEAAGEIEAFCLKKISSEVIQTLAKKELASLKAAGRKNKEGRPGKRWVPVLAAACGSAAVILLMFFVFRGPQEPATERAAGEWSIELIEPRGEIRQGRCLFEWSELAGAGEYILELYDKNLNLIWRDGGIIRPRRLLADQVFKSLQKDEVYFWKVTGRLSANQEIESDFAKFKIQ
jgi:hypothetical protein